MTMLEIRICSSCKRSLSRNDIEMGHAIFQEDGRLFCKECIASKVREEKGYDESEYVAESLLNEVKNINRTLNYRGASWLHILASVIQSFVFGTLILAYINRNSNADSYLLLALVFQVMALTFFVIKK